MYYATFDISLKESWKAWKDKLI